MRLVALAALSLALSGCLIDFGHCGFQLEGVEWKDYEFSHALSTAPGWNVSVQPPYNGFNHSDARLSDWNAAVSYVNAALANNTPIHISPSGVTTLSPAPVPISDEDRQAVRALIREITTIPDEELDRWLVDFLEAPDYLHDGYYPSRIRPDPESPNAIMTWGEYSSQLDKRQIRLDSVLETAKFPEEPSARLESNSWSLNLEFAATTAHQGPYSFSTSHGGVNEFRNSLWTDDTPRERALVEFASAFRLLNIGEPPSDAHVFGNVC